MEWSTSNFSLQNYSWIKHDCVHQFESSTSPSEQPPEHLKFWRLIPLNSNPLSQAKITLKCPTQAQFLNQMSLLCEEELNWIKETIIDRKRQILLVGLGFEGYCTQQSVSWTGEWQCKGMTSIPLHWLTTLHKLFDLSQSYQHPWDLWEFLPIIE